MQFPGLPNLNRPMTPSHADQLRTQPQQQPQPQAPQVPQQQQFLPPQQPNPTQFQPQAPSVPFVPQQAPAQLVRPPVVSLDMLFSGIEGAKASRAAAYDKAGIYWERIDRIKQGTNRSMLPFVAVEKTCIRVISDAGTGRRPGEQYSSLFRYGDYFLGDIKAFLCGVLGVAEGEITMAHATWAAGNEQPLAGMIVELNNFDKVTQQGKNFTQVRYVRRVPFPEVLRSLDPAQAALFFQPGELERMAAAESGQTPG